MTPKFVDVDHWRKSEDKTDLALAKAYTSDVEIVSADTIKMMIDADEVRDASGDREGFWFTVGTDQRDRDGDRMKQSGGDWANFRNNPVVPFAHDYGHFTGNKPVGKVVKLVRDTAKAAKVRRTRMLKQFTTEEENPQGAMVERLVRGKFLRAASIGFIPKDFEIDEAQEGEDEKARIGFHIKRFEGLESSVVVVPSNPGALAGAKEAGIDLSPMIPMLEKHLDGETFLLIPRDLAEGALKLIMPSKPTFTIDSVTFEKNPTIKPVTAAEVEAAEKGLDYELGLDGETRVKLWIAPDANLEFLKMAKSRIEKLIQSKEETQEPEDDQIVLTLE